ncbi:hypothetical protein [Alkaliphilus sp. B6464]|uniref:hypothetical protein n=1 Tax=Alkaliphilus sp. B6464 TaxID=2731219 RepID=UPI001BA820EF|nr:hypothetical protein [Alkaliphilus sp. B6464]QUH21849.1 hypothetical protein HYG84_18100 [Alkaliphilus sp. B6464]
MDNKKQKTVYFLLSYTGTWLSQLIKYATKIEYPHVSISLDRDFNELYSFGRQNPLNPFSAGFVKEDIENGVYAYFPNTICSIYALDITYEEYDKLVLSLCEFKKESSKYKYNFIGLFGVIINKPLNRENCYFCSQFVSQLLNNSGIELFDKPSELITSVDFIRSEKLIHMYTGKLNNPISSLSFEL